MHMVSHLQGFSIHGQRMRYTVAMHGNGTMVLTFWGTFQMVHSWHAMAHGQNALGLDLAAASHPAQLRFTPYF